jgi:predicted anti-sigma-YlaC factor YlaD
VARGERRNEVDTGCELIQEALVEMAGDSSHLSEAELRHLEGCHSCRALAEAESRLGELLETAVPPADPSVEEYVMRSLRPLRLRRRLAALLPVAASLLMALVGVAVLGGVPGGSLLAMLPVWSSQGWITILGAANDWVVALVAASTAAQLTLPPLVQGVALLLAVIASASLLAAARRWRRLSPWRLHA